MKAFKWIKWVVLAAAVVAAFGWAQLYLQDPIEMRYGGWQATPPASVALAAAVVLLLLLALALKLLAWVIFFPLRVAAWRRQRLLGQRQEWLISGMRAAALGDNKQALKHFLKLSAEATTSSSVYAWLAAEAADKLGETKKRNELLQQAAAGEQPQLAAAAKAQRARDEGRLSEAFNILAAAGAPTASPILTKMYLDISQKCGKWVPALEAAYQLRGSSPSAKWKKAVNDMVRLGLEKINDAEGLKSFWKNSVASDEQKNAALLAEYIYALHRVGDAQGVTGVLERAHKTAGDQPAILSAVAALGDNKMCESAFTAHQNRAQEKDGVPYLAPLAMLAERLGLWGKARRYYQMANSARPDPRYTKALAELEEKIEADNR